LVLDVDGARDYSAYLSLQPYRLVDVDVPAKLPLPPRKSEPALPLSPLRMRPHPRHRRMTPGLPRRNAAERRTKQSPPAAKRFCNRQNSGETCCHAGFESTPLKSKSTAPSSAELQPPTEPKPRAMDKHSLTRALGLKIGRIVIDPGHGGHDTGTIGPHGLMEKDLLPGRRAFGWGHLIETETSRRGSHFTRGKTTTFHSARAAYGHGQRRQSRLFISSTQLKPRS